MVYGRFHERLDDDDGAVLRGRVRDVDRRGDAWYFRVSDDPDPDGRCSSRLHVAFADRADQGWDGDVDWMSCFELVRTADPDGLLERSKLLVEDGRSLLTRSAHTASGRSPPRPPGDRPPSRPCRHRDRPRCGPSDHLPPERRLRAPFVWFGGKRRVAPEVWAALGDVPNHIEPFAGRSPCSSDDRTT